VKRLPRLFSNFAVTSLFADWSQVEGSSRLVLDEVTSKVVSLRELLERTLYRASSKILEPSTIVEDMDDDEEDEEVQVFGTDGQMKDMGGGKFIVVKAQKYSKVSGVVIEKLTREEDGTLSVCAEKRVCTQSDKGPECRKYREGMLVLDPSFTLSNTTPIDVDVTTVRVKGGTKQNGVGGRAVVHIKNDTRAVQVATSESFIRKGQAEEDEAEERIAHNGADKPAEVPLENGSERLYGGSKKSGVGRWVKTRLDNGSGVVEEEIMKRGRVTDLAVIPFEGSLGGAESSKLVDGKRKTEEISLEDPAEKDGADEYAANPLQSGSEGDDNSGPVNRKRKGEGVDQEESDKKRVCV
jgi:hypothetical protein